MTLQSDNAGRWDRLINDAGYDLELMAVSLRKQAERFRVESRSRKLAGKGLTLTRYKLRAKADQCILLARRAEELCQEMLGPES